MVLMSHYLRWQWHPEDPDIVWCPLPLLIWCAEWCVGDFEPQIVDGEPYLAFENATDFVLFRAMWFMR